MERSKAGLTLDDLIDANRKRQGMWPNGEKFTALHKAIEFGEEAGEVLGAIKKMERVRLGVSGSGAELEDLKDELGDLLITAIILSDAYDIDLLQAACNKFNKTSKKYDIDCFLVEETAPEYHAREGWEPVFHTYYDPHRQIHKFASLQADSPHVRYERGLYFGPTDSYKEQMWCSKLGALFVKNLPDGTQESAYLPRYEQLLTKD